MSKIRVGIVGIGGMGSNHVRSIAGGNVDNAEITAVCDLNPERLKWAREELGEKIRLYEDPIALYSSGDCDAVIIATPHYDHPPQAIKGFEHNLHVMIEKPAGVYTKQVREMNETAAKSSKVFGIMYNQRTTPVYSKLKDMISSGELGEIRRTNWIVTTWYRPQSYFDSGGWRATWKGEGGGVL
ncbi:MAG: Gfo/Idh/MocA family oxidoreductase, partial [Spirochaetales bacterium]|nr:Gfo/Idh/MocA family oxidoreductase [Spirochaetales bacterium]